MTELCKVFSSPRRGQNGGPGVVGFSSAISEYSSLQLLTSRSRPNTLDEALLNCFAGLQECLCESLCHVARLVLDKLPEPGGNVRLCDVDVIPGRHRRRAMPHQTGQRETVHAGL